MIGDMLKPADSPPVRSAGNAGHKANPALITRCSTALRRISEPGLALLLWDRPLPPSVGAEIARLRLDEVDDILCTAPPDGLKQVLHTAMDNAGYADCSALRSDILFLARQQAAITGAATLRVRLEVITTNACRKWHADYVTLRCITTYAGEATQWMEATSPEQADMPHGPVIHQMDAGAVGLFKGRLWQEDPTILHRSPPIAGTGAKMVEPRLVLVIDPAPAAMPALPGQPAPAQ